MAKPQPPYARLNQPPRSPHGRNRSAATKNHSDPLDGAGASARGANAEPTDAVRTSLPATAWRTINQPVMPFDPGNSSNLTYLQWAQQMQQAMKAWYMPRLSQAMDPRWDSVAPPSIPYTGIRSGEILGHRAWLVTDTFDLCSLAHYFVWEPGKTVEGDITEKVWDGMGIQPDRFGGVYAYSSFDLLRDDELVDTAKDRHKFPMQLNVRSKTTRAVDAFINGPWFYADQQPTYETITYLGLAYGTVKLWGETVEHEKGYRASFAKLVSIDGFIGVDGFDLAKLKGKYLFSDGK